MKKFHILVLIYLLTFSCSESSSFSTNNLRTPHFKNSEKEINSDNLRNNLLFLEEKLFSYDAEIIPIRNHNHDVNFNIPNLGILVNRVAYGEVPADHHLDKGGRSIEFNDQNYSVTVGVLKERPSIMIAMVRGTKTFQNIILDINALQESIGNELKIHKGFYKAYQDIKVTLFKLIIEMQKIYPRITDLFFMGHSLGGALANLAAVEYSKISINSIFKDRDLIQDSHPDLNKNISLSLITFGAPRVGNKYFADMANSLPFKYHYRVIIGNDPMPNVPFKNFITGDYLHSGTEIRYLENNEKDLNNPVLGEKNVDTCTSDLSFEFIKEKITSIQSHRRYFEIDPLPLWIIITHEKIGK